MTTPAPITLIKLGGSLITDKRRPRTARPKVIQRLAEEVARGLAVAPGPVVLGHGSGSFGHSAAAASDLGSRIDSPLQRVAIGITQQAARELHARVLEALTTAGCAPYSVAPGSWLVTRSGRPARSFSAPLEHALAIGLLPVVFGDVVPDLTRGFAIAATETVLLAVARRLLRHGQRVTRMLFFGDTDGVFDSSGERIADLDGSRWRRERKAAGPPVGTDVTGGIRLRVDTALAFARQGIECRILDGTQPGELERALGGAPVGGTRVTL